MIVQFYVIVSGSLKLEAKRSINIGIKILVILKKLTSTHKGSTAFEHFSWMLRPCEKSITSSSVPWITNTGEVIFDTLSMLKRWKFHDFNWKFVQQKWILISPWEHIKEPRSFCVRKCNSHAWHQRWMQYYGTNLIATCQIYCWYCANTLSIQNYIFWTDTVSSSELKKGKSCK